MRYKQIDCLVWVKGSRWEIIRDGVGEHRGGEDFGRESYKFRFSVTGSNSLGK